MIKIGYKLPNCAGVLCEPEWAEPETLEDLARRAHLLGYDSLWMHDHLLAPEEIQIPEPVIIEPLIAIGRLAALVPDIQFGIATLVLPLRDPVLTARQLMTLHMFFPGRIIAGVGVGRYESEFISFGSSWYRERGKVTSEFIRLMRSLWEEDEATFQGAYRTVESPRFFPKQGRRGELPIWVGGNSPAAIRRAASMGDGFVPAAKTPEEIREDRAALTRKLEELGRDPARFPIGLSLTIEAVHQQHARAEDLEERGLHGHGRERVAAGDAEAVAARLNEFIDAGVEHFLLSFRTTTLPQLKEDMEWFTAEVRPQLAHGVRA